MSIYEQIQNEQHPIPGLVLYKWTRPIECRASYRLAGYGSTYQTIVQYRHLVLHGFRVGQIVRYTRTNGSYVFRVNLMGDYNNRPFDDYGSAEQELERRVLMVIARNPSVWSEQS